MSVFDKRAFVNASNGIFTVVLRDKWGGKVIEQAEVEPDSYWTPKTTSKIVTVTLLKDDGEECYWWEHMDSLTIMTMDDDNTISMNLLEDKEGLFVDVEQHHIERIRDLTRMYRNDKEEQSKHSYADSKYGLHHVVSRGYMRKVQFDKIMLLLEKVAQKQS
jgi:hypothetical protein